MVQLSSYLSTLNLSFNVIKYLNGKEEKDKRRKTEGR